MKRISVVNRHHLTFRKIIRDFAEILEAKDELERYTKDNLESKQNLQKIFDLIHANYTRAGLTPEKIWIVVRTYFETYVKDFEYNNVRKTAEIVEARYFYVYFCTIFVKDFDIDHIMSIIGKDRSLFYHAIKTMDSFFIAKNNLKSKARFKKIESELLSKCYLIPQWNA